MSIEIDKVRDEIKGELFNVLLKPRLGHDTDTHVLIKLKTGDIDLISSLSSHWINDLFQVLIATKSYLKSSPKFVREEDGFGFKYKELPS